MVRRHWQESSKQQTGNGVSLLVTDALIRDLLGIGRGRPIPTAGRNLSNRLNRARGGPAAVIAPFLSP